MSSGPSDDQLIPAAEQQVAAHARYGPAGFAAVLINVLVLQFLTWVFILYWYMLPVTVLPAVIVDALIAYGLTRRRGTVAQVGRGMLIGCLSAPLTVVIFIPAWVIAQAIGPI